MAEKKTMEFIENKQPMTFIERIIDIQSRLNAPKSRQNTFGKYSYRSCEDILEAVKPLLKEHNLLMTISDEPYVTEDGWHYIKATATITDGKDSISTTSYAREPSEVKGMQSAQVSGSTISYANKYCCSSMLLLDDNKDADTDEFHKQTTVEGKKQEVKKAEPKKAEPKKMTEEERNAVMRQRIGEMLTEVSDEFIADLKYAFPFETVNDFKDSDLERIGVMLKNEING